MPADQPRFGKDQADNFELRLNNLEKQMRMRLTHRPHLPLHDMSVQGTPFPQDGAMLIDYTLIPIDVNTTYVPRYGYGGKWRRFGNNPVYEAEIVDPATVVDIADMQLIIMIPRKLDGYKLVDAQAYVTTVSSSGALSIQVRNYIDDYNLLSTPITINAGEFTSYSATQAVPDTSANMVTTGMLISIDVDASGTGAKGFGIALEVEDSI